MSPPGRGQLVFSPWVVVFASVLVWGGLSASGVFHPSTFPAPWSVAGGFVEEARSGRLLNDILTSLFRVGVGFIIAVALGVPTGLLLGQIPPLRRALGPAVNFFRNLSPLAWIPFAILWFGIGDVPAIFLISVSVFFPLALHTMAAVASIPVIYFRVARDFGLHGAELIRGVTLPAIMPEVVTGLRLAAGVAWMVVVAAEMVAGRDGLGYAVMDARNGLRTDLVVVQMIVIGVIGVFIDRLLWGLRRVPSVRWGYER